MQHAKTRCSRSPGPLVLCLHTRTMRPYDLQTRAWRSISSCCSVHVDGIKNGWSRGQGTTECAVHGQGKNVCPLSLWETNKWRLWFYSVLDKCIQRIDRTKKKYMDAIARTKTLKTKKVKRLLLGYRETNRHFLSWCHYQKGLRSIHEQAMWWMWHSQRQSWCKRSFQVQ